MPCALPSYKASLIFNKLKKISKDVPENELTHPYTFMNNHLTKEEHIELFKSMMIPITKHKYEIRLFNLTTNIGLHEDHDYIRWRYKREVHYMILDMTKAKRIYGGHAETESYLLHTVDNKVVSDSLYPEQIGSFNAAKDHGIMNAGTILFLSVWKCVL